MSAVALAPWRVLLVDDNTIDRAESKAALITGSSRRYFFSEAASADEAVTLCAATPAFDCVVLDFELLDGDALDVLARLPRDADGLLRAPVVILTVGAEPEKLRALVRAGAQDYVGKAWLGRESLTRAVENTVERHAMQRDLNRLHNRQQLMAERASTAGDSEPEALLALFKRVGALVDADLQYHWLEDSRAGVAEVVVVAGVPMQTGVGIDAASAAHLAAACADDSARFAADGGSAARPAGGSAAPLPTAADLLKGLGARAFLQHRIVAAGRLIATLHFASRSRDEFSRSDIDFIFAVGRLLSESSARTEIEAQLRDSEAFNSSLLDSSIDCVKVLGIDGRIQHMNENGRRLLGIDELDSLTQRKWSAFWPEAARHGIDAAVAAAAQGRPGTVEGECPTLSGTPKWWEVSLSPIRDAVTNKVSRLLVISRDMTARRADTQALQQSRAQLLAREHELRTLTDNAPDVMTRFDRDLRYVFVNAAVTCATGALPSQVIGKTHQELGMPAESCVVWDNALNAVFERGEPHEFEFELEGPLGLRHYLARLFPEPSDDGWVRHVLGVTHDVTDSKHNERRREQLHEAERVARLESERVAIVKDEFLATLSHELRTPIAAILGWASILRRPTVDAETLRRGIDVISRNGKMQARLIDDLLDMNRITSGKLKMEVCLVDIGMVATAVVDTLRPSAEAKGVVLEIQLTDSTAAQVRGDAARLQQVLANLMGNAIKFTPSGGVVTVSTDVLPGGSVRLSVKDTGMGIEPRFLTLLFDRFSQANGSAAREHGGLGLGLSIVRRLIELHGGTVTGHSEGSGRGALFVVTLPGATEEAPESTEPTGPLEPSTSVREPAQTATHAVPRAPEGELSLQGISVLLVDDQPDVLELVRRLLAECGAEVKVAVSGAAALAMLRHARPDILLSDIGMPGMDGYELIAQVRGGLALSAAALPAVALTAFTRLQDRARAIEAGYQAHLEKPIEPTLLIQTVRKLTAALTVRARG
jgi:PAS domain S-box-containing protein